MEKFLMTTMATGIVQILAVLPTPKKRNINAEISNLDWM